jgi:hypothetical protein
MASPEDVLNDALNIEGGSDASESGTADEIKEVKIPAAPVAPTPAPRRSARAAAPSLPTPPPVAVAAGPKRFRVSLQNAPTWVVEATDEANAYQVYKKVVGVVSAPYEPEVNETQEELGRVGS